MNSQKIIRVDPLSATGGKVSQLIESVKFIPLESTPASAFGMIDQLEVHKGFYFILDRQTNSILVFQQTGKFHGKIDGVKLIPGGQAYLFTFYLDKDKSEIIVPVNRQTFYFNFKGELLRKRAELSPGIQYDLGNGNIAYYSYTSHGRMPDSIAYEVRVSRDRQVVFSHFRYNTRFSSLKSDDIISSSHLNFYPTAVGDSSVYFLRPYDYSIYELSASRLSEIYKFVFPLNLSIPQNFVSDSSFDGKRKKTIKENANMIYGISNTFIEKDNLFFRTLKFSKPESFLYKLRSGDLINLEMVSADEKSFYLPITDAGTGGVDFANNGILNMNAGFVYTSYSSLVLFQQMQTTRSKKAKYPAELLNYFKNSNNQRGNPVIIQLEFKP